jgi:hypothetical protein
MKTMRKSTTKMDNGQWIMDNRKRLVIKQLSLFIVPKTSCIFPLIALLILLPQLAFNGFSQNNTFVYFTNGENKKETLKPVDLKNLNAIVVKNNGGDAADILFILKGAKGENLWAINEPITVKKDSSATLKINKDSLNAYLALNKNLYLDEEISGDRIMEHKVLIVPNDNAFLGKLYPFQDALKIAELLRKKSKNKNNEALINAILSRYCGVTSLDTNDLHAIYSNNSFIANNIFPYYLSLPKAQAQSFDFTRSDDAAFKATRSTGVVVGNSLGSLNATVVADAFAKIIIKRFKQDLNEIFFQKMRDEMEKNVELKTLLPRTYDGLRVMDKDVFQFNQFIEGLRQKMEEDLSNVFSNTNDLLESDKYRVVFKGNQTLRAFLTTVTQFSDGLIRKQDPSVVIGNIHFSDAYDESDEGRNLKGYLQTLQLFSRGLATDKGTWEEGLDNLNQLFQYDAKACQIWLGLLHQMAADDANQPFAFENGLTVRQTINKLYDKRNGFYGMETYVKGIIRRVNQINMSTQTVNKAQEGENNTYWDKLIALYDNTISLVKFVPTITETFDSQYVMPRNWFKGIYIAETLPRIYTEMQSRHYNAAIQHIAGLVKAVDFRDIYVENYQGPINSARIYRSKSANSVIKDYTELKGNYIKNKAGDFILIKKLYLDSTLKTPVNNEGLDKFIKYASFSASLALAKTSDEVANLLESTMVPPGSTRMKEYGYLLGINSYLGLQYVGKGQNGTDIVSISAPIGLNYSIGIPRKPRLLMTPKERFWDYIAPHNVQAIFTLVDIGAIVGLRFKDGQSELPKITLDNIFSPGVIVQFGRLFNLPLNIGVGYQSQPRLYGINGTMTSFQSSSFKWNLNLNWDIPLWNFWFKEFESKN